MASKPKINKMITKVNFSDSNRSAGQIKYLVKHFVGATGGAEANCRYFYDTYRGASAHFFVGHNGEIWQCVEENDTAWHCGAKTYKHKDIKELLEDEQRILYSRTENSTSDSIRRILERAKAKVTVIVDTLNKGKENIKEERSVPLSPQFPFPEPRPYQKEAFNRLKIKCTSSVIP